MTDSSESTRQQVIGGRALVVGLGVTGRAVASALVAHGVAVTVTDDAVTPDRPAEAAALGAHWVDPPPELGWEVLLAAHDIVVPSPGIPERHPLFAAAVAAGVPVRSEFDLAAVWDDRPVALVTGTNGKTTVTTLITDMLVASGLRAVAAGNVEVPLVAAIEDPAVDVFVVEASSFRLTFATAHRPVVGTWLNFAPDHLDVHLGLDGYRDAKAKVWAGGGVAVANSDDAVVAAMAPTDGRTQTFGVDAPADWHVAGGRLLGPDGLDLGPVSELHRALPHDLSNALAAAATAFAAGATAEGIRTALRSFRGLPHRVELVGEAGGVRWYDDSKATAPHATVAALGGFDRAVLIAGGRNKGLDLGELAGAGDHVCAVVAIGDSADDVAAAFQGLVPVVRAGSMDDAVAAASGLASDTGAEAVLLSPGCASFDWYGGYAERGEDFQRAVRDHMREQR